MSTLSINGTRVISAAITFPRFGAWAADVVLAESVALDSSVVLVVGDLEVSGTVIRQADFASSRSARIVGGKAGWRKVLPAKGYSHIIGVQASSVLGDAASESGETINVASDRALGTHWARSKAKAETTLHMLTGGQWWIDAKGVTQTGDRDSSAIVTPFTVLAWSGGKGQFEIGTESIAPWQPGRTFSGPTTNGVQTISSVTIEATNEGKIALHVLTTTKDADRLLSGVRDIVQAELAPSLFAAVWEYTIAPNPLNPGLTSTVDVSPTDDRMPPLTSVPLYGMGIVSPPITGTTCRIRFVNSDPSRPECFELDGTTEHVMTTEACVLLIYNVVQTLTLVNPGPWFGVAMQPLLAAAILTALAAQAVPAPPGLIAQVAAAAAQTAVITAGTAPATTVGPFAAAIAALPTKILDLSGLFPSLGVPQ